MPEGRIASQWELRGDLRPLVTILMPLFNGERFLIEAIDSLLRQDLDDFELWVIDGGSTDLSPEIVRRFMQRDGRVRLFVNAGTSPVHRTNEAMGRVSSPYFGFMHADDLCAPNRLSRQLSHLEMNPALAMLGSATRYWFHDLRERGAIVRSGVHRYPCGKPRIWARLPFWWCFSLPSLLFRTKLVQESGIVFDPVFSYVADYKFYFEMAAKHEVDNLDEPLLWYRLHNDSDGPRNAERIALESRRVRMEILSRLGFVAQMESEAVDSLLSLHIAQDHITNSGEVSEEACRRAFAALRAANLRIGRPIDPVELSLVTDAYLSRAWPSPIRRARSMGSNFLRKVRAVRSSLLSNKR